jgi:hypothetical protein
MAFPSLITPVGYTQFLWRSSRAKVIGENRELQAIGPKPFDGEPLSFTVVLLDGRRLLVTVTDACEEADDARP